MEVTTNLLRDRRFSPVFWTQFFGAFNDNVFKNALVIFITIRDFSIGGVSSQQMVALCGGIFILPFFLFSATAGQLADKVSKSRLMMWIKVWEILVMAIGAYGFLTGSVLLLLVTLFFMGLHSAFFGPVKYSILPQLLRKDELVSGNAYVEMGTLPGHLGNHLGRL
jgi:MFS family permease